MIMNNLKMLILVALFSVCTLHADTAKCDESDELTAEQGFAAAGDLVIVRPIAAATTVAAFGIFAVVSPFAAMADAVPEVWNTLVQEPGEYTFTRDLGDWSK